jgi:hypothetical protein
MVLPSFASKPNASSSAEEAVTGGVGRRGLKRAVPHRSFETLAEIILFGLNGGGLLIGIAAAAARGIRRN